MPVFSLLWPLLVAMVVLYLISLVPGDPTVKKIIYTVVILGIVLWIIHVLFGIGPGITLR
jgi:hypothetical protein